MKNLKNDKARADACTKQQKALHYFFKVNITRSVAMLIKKIAVVSIIGLGVATTAFSATSASAAASDQAAINTLQQQIKAQAVTFNKALEAQQTATQAAITNLQSQTQAQFAHLQTQMQQMQTELNNEIKQVQTEMVSASSPKK